MARPKEVINLQAGTNGFSAIQYKVVSLTNRLEPKIGSVLETKDVELLLKEARQPHANLTVNVK